MKTTNFEISKMLKEAGFKAQACDCYWDEEEFEAIYAYDLETILEALGDKGHISLFCGSRTTGINFNDKVNVYLQENESLADTAGRLWLKLKEKDLV
jgi:hypothetical protein